jgi:hypothetical protein
VTQFNTNPGDPAPHTEEELDFDSSPGARLPWLEVDWRTAYSRTTQATPDTRNLTYDVGTPDNPYPPEYQNDAVGGYRVFGALDERLTDSAVDFTVPFRTGLPGTDFWSGLPAKFMFGPAFAYRDRDHNLRFLRYQFVGSNPQDRQLPPEQLLNPALLGLPNAPIEVVDTTQERDRSRRPRRSPPATPWSICRSGAIGCASSAGRVSSTR